MPSQPLSLKKKVFNRLLVITVIVVLAFYCVALFLNLRGIDTLKRDLQRSAELEMSHLASEVNMEVSALFTSCQELASDTDLTRYAIASETYTPWERVDKITQLSGQLLRIKRFSPLVETAEILLPNLNRVVVTDRTIYDTMDQKEWDELSACLNGSTQAVGMVGEDLYLLCTYFYKVKPAFIFPSGSRRRICTAGWRGCGAIRVRSWS